MADCANCGASLAGPYCSQCGQEDGPILPSVRAFLREFGDEHLGLDSKIGRTLRELIAHPGALTIEYLAGHRARFVRPLRLYISASVLFFLVLALRGRDAGMMKISLNNQTPTAHASWLDRRLEQQGAKLRAIGPDAASRAFAEKFTHWLGDAMFLLLPVFAAIVGLLVRGTHSYGEHFVFALHIHAFAFLALIPPLLVPASWRSATDLFGLVVVVYAILALRRVYRLTRLRTAFTATTLGVVYGIALTIVTAALAMLTLLTMSA